MVTNAIEEQESNQQAGCAVAAIAIAFVILCAVVGLGAYIVLTVA